MGKTIRSISVRGASDLNRHKLESATGLRLNTHLTKEKLKVAVRALLATGLVDSVKCAGEKTGHLTFNVRELPVVKNILFRGNLSVKEDLLQRQVETELEKPISPTIIKEDMARIVELYKRQGLESPAVKHSMEVSDRNTADVVITILEHGISWYEEPLSRSRARNLKRREQRNQKRDAEILPESLGDSDARENTNSITSDGRRRAYINAIHNEGPSHVGDGSSPASSEAVSRRDPPDRFADQETHQAYAELTSYPATWTGRFTFQDHVRAVRTVAPRVMSEIDTLVRLVEAQRFNDPETEAALELLRSLHTDLGELIEAVEVKKDKPLLVRISRKNGKLIRLIKTGAKVGAVAPALTIGISHLLSALTKVPIDSTMISTVFATMIAMPIVEQQIEAQVRK